MRVLRMALLGVSLVMICISPHANAQEVQNSVILETNSPKPLKDICWQLTERFQCKRMSNPILVRHRKC